MKEKKEISESIGRFDFEQARIKHVLFKSKLRALLYGADIDTEPVLSTTKCALGVWINQMALPHLGHLPEVRELEHLHNQMHEIARHIWQLYQGGKQERALEELQKIDETAESLLRLLTQIERKVLKD